MHGWGELTLSENSFYCKPCTESLLLVSHRSHGKIDGHSHTDDYDTETMQICFLFHIDKSSCYLWKIISTTQIFEFYIQIFEFFNCLFKTVLKCLSNDFQGHSGYSWRYSAQLCGQRELLSAWTTIRCLQAIRVLWSLDQ